MVKLINIGKVKPKSAKLITDSRLGIGFEKLDRGAFDPEAVYDRVAELGVKWIRLQSGWKRTEREKNIYDFTWLDEIVDNLISRGLKPWLCLCYGNDLYDEFARKYYGAVGCPPIYSDEQKQAWKNYVIALTNRYKGKIEFYEIWNEPDHVYMWKKGINATEYGNFVIETAKIIKSVDTSAKVIGGAIAWLKPQYMIDFFNTGVAQYIDCLSFHSYHGCDERWEYTYNTYRSIVDMYNPNIQLIQGEAGAASRSDGSGAYSNCEWTESKQAKFLLRHLIYDLSTDNVFTSYFSTVDMIEGTAGVNGKKETYLDYGYFGVLGAEFDENGVARKGFYKKPSYYALQNLASVFDENVKTTNILYTFPFNGDYNDDIFDFDVSIRDIKSYGFLKSDGSKAIAYYCPKPLFTTDFSSFTQIYILCNDVSKIKIIDLMDGSIYAIPKENTEVLNNNYYKLKNIPIKDYPMLLDLGGFVK